MSRQAHSKPVWSVPRRFVAGAAAAVAALVASHGLAALIRGWIDPSAASAALELTLGAVFAAAVGGLALPRRSAHWLGALAGCVAAAATLLSSPGAGLAVVAVPIVALVSTVAAARFGERLPMSLEETWSRRRGMALLWAVLALVAVFQTGRLATYMTDPEVDFVVGTRHPFWYGHQCLSAYLHGAELASWREENIYVAEHYFHHAENPRTEIDGLWVEDPYQYPPQFLLLPALALELTQDLTLLRVGWFIVSFSLFVVSYTWLACWVGGRGGRVALWLLPGVLVSFPFLYNFQFGQFHLASVCLAVLGMLAIAARRRAVGGLLLAVAVLAKLFPAVLLVVLAAQRRFRALGWTFAWSLALTLLTLAVFGGQPFVAFFDYHLPRLGNGAAFAFDEAFPELAELVIGDNQGVFGLALKLGSSKAQAAAIGRVFTLGLLLLAAIAGWRNADTSRWGRGSLWLALLGLGSLASPGAWGDYVPSTAVWLLALVAALVAEERRLRAPFVVTAVFQVFLVGTMPIAGWGPPAVMIPLSAVGVVTMLALFGSVAASSPRRWLSSTAGGEVQIGEEVVLERAA